MDWSSLPNDEVIEEVARALRERGIDVFIVNDSSEARRLVLNLIPEGSEVYTMTSVTLEQTGLYGELDESGRYVSIRKLVASINDPVERRAARRKYSSAKYVVGSVHAVTQEGQLVIASQSGSQLAPYAYTAENVILVVGAQKIVRNLDEALRRIREYVVPLEDERSRRAYGTGTGLNKLLIIEREVVRGRIKVILVKEVLGF